MDFVISWVDGNDRKWREEKRKYMAGEEADDKEERYRDWENLRYWFRGVEQYAPFVEQVHFLTYGHLPAWLNTNHPKLRIVRHEAYIPEEYLPTFNSHTIELCMHKIPGLSEQFVYFNDDMFLTSKITPEFFFRAGKPCDMLAFQPVVANPQNPVMSHIYLNNTLVLSKYFKKRENVKKQPHSYFKFGYPPLYFFYNLLELAFPLFTGFYTAHGPSPFLKSTFEELWEKEKKLLGTVCSHKFRDSSDVSPYLFREWQKLTGQFVPSNVMKGFRYFNVSDDNSELIHTIMGGRAKVVCINDANVPIAFEKAKQEIQYAFERLLPQKSSYER